MQRSAIFSVAAVVLSAGIVMAQSVATISKGDASEQDTARQVTARTAAEWQAVWNAHAPNTKPPAVDLSTKMVVGVFLGTKPSTGYEVEIVNTKEDAGALVVSYVLRQPKRGELSAQILTQPYHLVAVARHADPVRFVQVADSVNPPVAAP